MGNFPGTEPTGKTHHLDKENHLRQNSIFQKKYKSQEWGNEMYLIVYQNDIEFILKRIKYLIKKYKL